MKHLGCGAFTAFAVGFGLSVLATNPSVTLAAQGNNGLLHATPVKVAQAGPPADFGSPPSGEYPILFNDHHVYARPDTLRQGRVLAALVRGSTILVPLRSMFEQMGATVSFDPASKTVDVSKPGADIKVTVGKPEVVINGETRPLDVAPMIYRGTVMVPVRVISEGMGAYVQWVPDKRTVVVRYAPAPPPTPPPSPPPPPPTAAPSPPPAPVTPAPTPTPAPTKAPYADHYIVGDYLLSPKIYNEFSPGNTGTRDYTVRGAFELPNMPIMIGADWRHFEYPHNAGNVNIIGGGAATFVPGFTAREDDVDARLGFRFAQPRLYIAGSYLWQNNNYGYPQLRGWGAGLEKLPDLNQGLSLYASAYYYPNVNGFYGPTELAYRLWKYQIGLNWNFAGPSFPLYLDVGYMGNWYTNKLNAPSNISDYGPYVGLGIHF